MWKCPVCGQSFVTRNLPHSCLVVGLDEFFAGRWRRERTRPDWVKRYPRRRGG